MKKIVFLLLSLLLLLSAVSCSQSGETVDTAPDSAAATEAPETAAPETDPPESQAPVERPTGTPVKVIMIAGQSNAVGYALDSSLSQSDPRYDADRIAKLSAGFSNVLIRFSNNPFEDPANGKQFGPYANETFEPVTFNQACRPPYDSVRSIGPELGLAERLSEVYPDETFYIVKCATSGANLSNRWNVGARDFENNLYQQMVDFTTAAMLQLEEQGLAPEIVAFCWMQGESDAQEGNIFGYAIQFNDLIKNFKSELARYIPDNGMSTVDAGITRHWSGYQSLNKAKVRFQGWSNKRFYFETDDLTLNSDGAHYDGFGQLELGRRFAEGVIQAIGMLDQPEILTR